MDKFSKTALIVGGLAAVCGATYILWPKRNKSPSTTLSASQLCKILQYTKYQYRPILEGISATIRGAKEEMKYNDAFADDMRDKCKEIVFII